MQRSLISSASHYNKLEVHIQKTFEILEMLNQSSISAENALGSFRDQRITTQKVKQEVCPEKFMGKQLDYGYPFFRKGFGRVDCKEFIPIAKLVTLVAIIPTEFKKPAQNYLEILQGVSKYYPGMGVIMITKELMKSHVDEISKLNVAFESLVDNEALSQGALLNRALDKVRTPYVLMASNITHFDDDIDLERMVRVLSYEPRFSFVGGAHRNLKGQWDMGCQQVAFRNMTARYMGGYYRSFNECVVCDYLSGPIMAKTETFKKMEFDPRSLLLSVLVWTVEYATKTWTQKASDTFYNERKMGQDLRSLLYLDQTLFSAMFSMECGAFRDLFWRFKHEMPGNIAASCPDVMFNIHDREIDDAELVTFANKHLIHRIVEADGRIRWYGCRNGYSYTSASLCKKSKGMGLSPADMENLADLIKFFMRACQEAGALCEIQSGTLLGAVKFNGVLPWEIDGDIAFLSRNFSVIENLKAKIQKAGYSLSVGSRSSAKSRGYFAVKTTNWNVELWGFAEFSSHMDVARGVVPTKVRFAGQWVNHPHNPGLFARNHYGAGIYKHQEHWRRLNHRTSWTLYTPGSFKKCPQPGHSSCLDQYPADGNMQFRDYCPS